LKTWFVNPAIVKAFSIYGNFMIQHLIFSQYPLTIRYMKTFSEELNCEPEVLVISNITAKNYIGVLKHLRAYKVQNLYLPIISDASWLLLPLLKALSLFVSSKSRHIVHPDFSIESYKWDDGALQLLQIAKGVFFGMRDFAATWLRMKFLSRVSRLSIRENDQEGILYLKTNLWLGVQAGGAIAHTNGVISGFMRKNYSVDFVSAEPPISFKNDSNLGFVKLELPDYYIVPRDLNYFTHCIRTYKQIKKRAGNKYRFIYQRLSTGNFTGVLLSRYFRIPLILEYNGAETWLAKNWGRPLLFSRMIEGIENACLRHASVVITVSDVLGDELLERGVEAERIAVYPNGVDPEIFDPDRFSQGQRTQLRQRCGINEDAVVATFVGTFGHWHGVDVLAETLRYLVNEHKKWLEKSKLHILFVGDGAKRTLVEEILSHPDIHPYFTLAGLIPQDEAPMYMAASDILLSPHVPNPDKSPFFGSPTKLFEYLAIGRPIIASDLFQVGEVLSGSPRISADIDASRLPDENVCGILVEPGEPEELARALMFLVDNPEWRHQAGVHCRKRAMNKYTWDHHVSAIEEKLTSVNAYDAPEEYLENQMGRPIRLLFNALHSKSGGGITYLENMLPLFVNDKEFDVHICIHESQEKLLPVCIEKATLHAIDFKESFWNLLIAEQTALPVLAHKIKADVTFSPANFGPFFCPKPVILLRNALSVASIEKRPLKFAYWVMLYIGTAISFALSKKAISVSAFASRTLGSFFSESAINKIAIVPHGINDQFKRSAFEGEREEFLLAVSDIYVQKNLHNLFLALARLKDTFPDILLKVAGKPIDQDYYKILHEIIEKENLHDNVEFLGHQTLENLVKLYQTCDIFIFPSKIETFGNPLAEAMACGAPIICSSTAAMPEVTADAAEYFDPDEIDEMIQVITKVKTNPDIKKLLSQKSLKRSEYYSWNKTYKDTSAIIKKVVTDA